MKTKLLITGGLGYIGSFTSRGFLKHNKYKIIKIICTMIFQIFSGKLLLSYKDGETFVFLLKFK